MANDLPRRFLDSVVITKYVENQPEAEEIALVIDDARAGRVQLVISTITLLEATRAINRYDARKHAMLLAFFENDYILPVELDVQLAKDAIDLLYDHMWLHPRDAGNLAAAIRAGCQIFYTYDGDLLDRFNGQRGLAVIQPGTVPAIDTKSLPLFNQPQVDKENS